MFHIVMELIKGNALALNLSTIEAVFNIYIYIYIFGYTVNVTVVLFMHGYLFFYDFFFIQEKCRSINYSHHSLLR